MELRKLRLVGTASDWRKLGKTNRIILYTAIFAAALLACSLFLAFSFPNPIEERLSWRPLFLRKSGNGNSASFLSFLVPIDDPSGGSLVTEKESAGSLGDGSQSRKDESSPLDPGVVKTDEEGSRSTVAEKAKRSELDEFSRNVEGKLNESEQGSKSSVESKKKREKKKKKKKKENYGSEEFKQNSEKEDESLVQRSSEIVMDEYATRNDVVVTGFGKDKSSPELKVDQGINNQTSDLKQGNKNEEVSNGSSQIPGEENKNEDFSNEITASQKAEKKEDDIPLTQSEENKKQELSNRASRIREEENRNEVLSNGTTVIKKEGNKNTNLSNGTLAIQPAKNNNNDLSNGTSAMDKKEKKVDVSSGISVIQKDDNKNSSLSSNGTSSEMSQKEPKKCDLFMGKWVPDDTRPLYAAGSCPHIDESFNCFRNRRPDNLYERWRWQPHDCDIPRLNATDMLERLRNKRLTFVGDSLNRNMWESLVCILRDSVSDKSRVYEISGKKQFRTEGFYAFRYEDYNCTVEYVRAPFLVQEWEVEEGNGKKKETLRLDVIESSLSKVKDADIVIFNTGHWWTHEKTSKGQDYYQEGDYVYPELNVLEAYRKALKSWSNWVDSNLDPKKTTTLFRGYSATHFSGGQWNSGGQCHTETEPIYNETYITKYPPKMEVLESVLHEMKTEIFYLNITRMTDYRKEAHPSIYRKEFLSQEERIKQERYQDCSHWCLPGVPDIWNELVYAALLMTNKGSWRK